MDWIGDCSVSLIIIDVHILLRHGYTTQARVQEFVRGGGGPKSESLFFFSNFQGGGPAQKIAENMIFSTKKVAKHR